MNFALTSNFPWRDYKEPLNKLQYQLLQTALAEAGYSESRYAILEPLCSVGLREVTEKRKAGLVQYYINALALGIDLETIPNIQTCEFFGVGSDIDFAATRAILTTALTGVNNDLTFTAKQRGTIGNSISITYVVAGDNTPLSIIASGRDITVNVATGAGGAATSTSISILNAIRNNVVANSLVSVENATGNTGTGIVTAFAKTTLAGGTDQ